MTEERLKQIITRYIDNDLEAVSELYIRDVLIDTCGCSDEEIIELGYDWLLDVVDEFELI